MFFKIFACKGNDSFDMLHVFVQNVHFCRIEEMIDQPRGLLNLGEKRVLLLVLN